VAWLQLLHDIRTKFTLRAIDATKNANDIRRPLGSASVRVFVRLLEEHAEQALRLAYQSRNKKAERFLRLLAVDLALAAEEQRNRIPDRPAAAKSPAAAVKPVPVKKTRGLNPEMLRELESLRLIIGPNAHSVEALRALEHMLVNKPANDLPVLKNEGNLARANL
jgi:hypothetical protein